MRYRISKPSPSMVVSVLALSVAMGGTSYAAATIGSGQIKNNSILSKDVRNNTLQSKDVRNGTLKGEDVRNNTLTGKDILESRLGKVPTAASVDHFVTFNVGMSRGDARTKLATLGPVTLYGTCVDDAGDAHGTVTAETTAPHTYTYDDYDLNPGEVANVNEISGSVNAGTEEHYASIEPMFFSGEAGGSFDNDGESAAIIIGGLGADCRFVGSIPLIPAG